MSGAVERDWWVFSTALVEVVLMLECRKTGAYGIVRNPTKGEWSAAFTAPSHPYRWTQPERVELIEESRAPQAATSDPYDPSAVVAQLEKERPDSPLVRCQNCVHDLGEPFFPCPLFGKRRTGVEIRCVDFARRQDSGRLR